MSLLESFTSMTEEGLHYSRGSPDETENKHEVRLCCSKKENSQGCLGLRLSRSVSEPVSCGISSIQERQNLVHNDFPSFDQLRSSLAVTYYRPGPSSKGNHHRATRRHSFKSTAPTAFARQPKTKAATPLMEIHEQPAASVSATLSLNRRMSFFGRLCQHPEVYTKENAAIRRSKRKAQAIRDVENSWTSLAFCSRTDVEVNRHDGPELTPPCASRDEESCSSYDDDCEYNFTDEQKDKPAIYQVADVLQTHESTSMSSLQDISQGTIFLMEHSNAATQNHEFPSDVLEECQKSHDTSEGSAVEALIDGTIQMHLNDSYSSEIIDIDESEVINDVEHIVFESYKSLNQAESSKNFLLDGDVNPDDLQVVSAPEKERSIDNQVISNMSQLLEPYDDTYLQTISTKKEIVEPKWVDEVSDMQDRLPCKRYDESNDSVFDTASNASLRHLDIEYEYELDTSMKLNSWNLGDSYKNEEFLDDCVARKLFVPYTSSSVTKLTKDEEPYIISVKNPIFAHSEQNPPLKQRMEHEVFASETSIPIDPSMSMVEVELLDGTNFVINGSDHAEELEKKSESDPQRYDQSSSDETYAQSLAVPSFSSNRSTPTRNADNEISFINENDFPQLQVSSTPSPLPNPNCEDFVVPRLRRDLIVNNRLCSRSGAVFSFDSWYDSREGNSLSDTETSPVKRNTLNDSEQANSLIRTTSSSSTSLSTPPRDFVSAMVHSDKSSPVKPLALRIESTCASKKHDPPTPSTINSESITSPTVCIKLVDTYVSEVVAMQRVPRVKDFE